ncbi:hypothetical protein KESI111651_01430 [Kerstersia similis]
MVTKQRAIRLQAIELQKPMSGEVRPASWGKRLAWLAGIWLASILVLTLMAYGMRLLMSAAGMTAGQDRSVAVMESMVPGPGRLMFKAPPDAVSGQAATAQATVLASGERAGTALQARGMERS